MPYFPKPNNLRFHVLNKVDNQKVISKGIVHAIEVYFLYSTPIYILPETTMENFHVLISFMWPTWYHW